MIILYSTAVIVAYMINGNIGFLLMALYIAHLFLLGKGDLKEKCLQAIIFSVPMGYIGIQGMEGGHVVSWYNIFVLLFMIIVLNKTRNKIKLPINLIYITICIPVVLLINLIWSSNLQADIVEICQIFLMLFPILIMHGCRDTDLFNQKFIKICINFYANICVSSAISMIIQYIYYNSFGQRIGIYLISGSGYILRNAYYMLFRGASILPIYLTTGFLILFIDIIRGEGSILNWIKCGIILIAVSLESSRTGMVSLIITVFLIYVNNLKQNKVRFGSIFPLFGFGLGAFYGINQIMASRKSLGSLLDNNGRTSLLSSSYSIWTANIKNFLIGEGFTGGLWIGNTKPHNYLLQSVAQCGIIFTICVAVLIISYLHGNKKNRYRYLVWLLLISGLFVTDFYANAFATVVFILVDLHKDYDKGMVNMYEATESRGEMGI